MYGVKLARELGDKGYTVLLIHPGYVKTDMVRVHLCRLFCVQLLTVVLPQNNFDGGGDITTEEAVCVILYFRGTARPAPAKLTVSVRAGRETSSSLRRQSGTAATSTTRARLCRGRRP